MEYLVVLLIFVVFLQTRIMELRRAVYCLAAQSGIIAGACLVIGLGAGGGLHALLPGLLTLLVKVLFIPGAMLRLIGRITDAREIYSDINVNYSTLAAALWGHSIAAMRAAVLAAGIIVLVGAWVRL